MVVPDQARPAPGGPVPKTKQPLGPRAAGAGNPVRWGPGGSEGIPDPAAPLPGRERITRPPTPRGLVPAHTRSRAPRLTWG